MTRTLTPEEVGRAVIVDFEGRQDEPPVLLGVLAPDGDFTQYVIDADLASAAAAKAKGTADQASCVLATPAGALEAVRRLARRHDAPVVGYSKRERLAFLEIEPGLGDWVEATYVDGKETAKRWARRVRPDYEFVVPKGRRGGKHTLDQFFTLTGYDVPRSLGPGNTGSRIKDVRDELARKGDFARLTPTTKGKWSRLLGHNRHDCVGLRHVLEVAATDLADGRQPTDT